MTNKRPIRQQGARGRSSSERPSGMFLSGKKVSLGLFLLSSYDIPIHRSSFKRISKKLSLKINYRYVLNGRVFLVMFIELLLIVTPAMFEID